MSPQEVFAIYTDIERWQNRSLFGEIRWVHGKPWEEGSRLRIETRVPVRSTVDRWSSIFRERECELPQPRLRHYLRNESLLYGRFCWANVRLRRNAIGRYALSLFGICR